MVMSLRERIGRALAGAADNLKRKTSIMGTATPSYFPVPGVRTPAQMALWRAIYNQGGLVSSLIDAHPLFILANGYRFEGDQGLVDNIVTPWIEAFDFNDTLWQMINDSLIIGDGFGENVKTMGGQFFNVEVRPAEKFDFKTDAAGVVTSYSYGADPVTKQAGTPLNLEDVTRLTLYNTPGQVYGQSLIGRAIDDITRDTMVVSGMAKAIQRHGYPKWHVQTTAPGTSDKPAEPLTSADALAIDQEFQRLNTKQDLVTDGDVRISPLDTSVLTGAETYTKVSERRLCAAFGVPLDVVGLEETSGGMRSSGPNVRLEAWYKKISTMQRKVARCVDINILDRIMPGENKGKVKMVFNEVEPEVQIQKIAAYAQLLQADPQDPWAVISREQFYNFVGWDIGAYTETPPTAAVTERKLAPMQFPFNPQQQPILPPGKGAKQ